MNQREGMDIHPTADIHPSVILEGHISIGAYTRIDAGTVIKGDVTIGHHTLIRCNTTLRGRIVVGSYTHIYDAVCIEGGRPALVGGSLAEEPDRAIIGDECWVNHGATMHGTQIANRGAVGLNACCDYDTHIGEGAILGNGSATNVGQVIPPDTLAEGVPARVVREGLTDDDRQRYFGVLPAAWTHYEAEHIEADIKRRRTREA